MRQDRLEINNVNIGWFSKKIASNRMVEISSNQKWAILDMYVNFTKFSHVTLEWNEGLTTIKQRNAGKLPAYKYIWIPPPPPPSYPSLGDPTTGRSKSHNIWIFRVLRNEMPYGCKNGRDGDVGREKDRIKRERIALREREGTNVR